MTASDLDHRRPGGRQAQCGDRD